jgi:predicted AlkP superfamily phosphohydrolase/phosphomutase
LNHPTKYLEFNDTGPDDANHDHYGIYIHTTTDRLAAGENGPGERDDLRLVDVGPTILDRFGLSVQEEASGQPIDL